MSSCLYSTIFTNRGTRRTLCVHEKNDEMMCGKSVFLRRIGQNEKSRGSSGDRNISVKNDM